MKRTNLQKYILSTNSILSGADLPSATSDLLQIDELAVLLAIKTFPAGSAGGPDKLRPQILKDIIGEQNGVAGKNFIKVFTKLINIILAGKIPTAFRPYFFGANLFALAKKDGGNLGKQRYEQR